MDEARGASESDPDRLLAAVLAAPHDLAPRRAYARAVRANEPERAALIDHQLAIRDALRAGRTPPERDMSEARALIRRFGERWSGPVRHSADDLTYWGGFVEEIRVKGTRLAEVAALMRDVAPVRMLTVTNLRGHLQALLDEPRFAQLVALDIGENGLSDADVAALAAAPALRGLAVLRIAGNLDCGYPALRALTQLPALRFVNADDTRTPLRISTLDAVSGEVTLDYTAAQGVMEAELGPLPWLEALTRPSNHVL
jgi:hypothetical protein